MVPDPANVHEIKQLLQAHLSDGLVIVVGSGLSCAEGVPGMGQLATHLSATVGASLAPGHLAEWKRLVLEIATKGLEAALLESAPSPEVEAAVSQVTGSYIELAERKIITEIFNSSRTLRLSRLLTHVLKPNTGLPIVTTNYDRLIEVAAEEIGLGVDTMFVGSYAARLDERQSRMSFCRDVKLKDRRAVYSYKERALVFKPHGSLDWYLRKGVPVRYTGNLEDGTRLIITPGRNKFRSGYNSPFDAHRDRANAAIDKAGRFLILGYGFNDDHLETHLTPAIRRGKPALLLTKSLSPSARALAEECSNVIALEEDALGTKIFREQKTEIISGSSIWDLNNFVTEVLEP